MPLRIAHVVSTAPDPRVATFSLRGTAMATSPHRGRGPAGWLLGFALGGFFDGILLHQVLQWHHLLSALQGGPFDDLRVQLLADGCWRCWPRHPWPHCQRAIRGRCW